MTSSQRRLEAAKAEASRLWVLMCQHEQIDPASAFVSFSDDNPFLEEHRRAMDALFSAREKERKNAARRGRHEAYTSLGLKRVKGALGGVYYE